MPGRVIKMAESKKYKRTVTVSFNYTCYDSYVDTINNFIQALMEAATDFNDNKPDSPSAYYNLASVQVTEDDNIETKDKEDGI